MCGDFCGLFCRPLGCCVHRLKSQASCVCGCSCVACPRAPESFPWDPQPQNKYSDSTAMGLPVHVQPFLHSSLSISPSSFITSSSSSTFFFSTGLAARAGAVQHYWVYVVGRQDRQREPSQTDNKQHPLRWTRTECVCLCE